MGSSGVVWCAAGHCADAINLLFSQRLSLEFRVLCVVCCVYAICGASVIWTSLSLSLALDGSRSSHITNGATGIVAECGTVRLWPIIPLFVSINQSCLILLTASKACIAQPSNRSRMRVKIVRCRCCP